VQEAIADGTIPGAVVGAEDASGHRVIHAWGRRAVQPEPEPMTPDTLFDLASITKPLATAPAALLPPVRRRFPHGLDTPLAAILPEADASPLGCVHIRDFLRHTSGLPPYLAIDKIGERNAHGVLRAICDEPLRARPGERVIYSCLNYIVLGLAVQHLMGERLDRILRRHVWQPAGITDLTFFPADTARCVPTTCGPGGDCLRGVVHDPLARIVQDGGEYCSGNAGLFGSAEALLDYARLLLDLWNGRKTERTARCELPRRAVQWMWRPATPESLQPAYGCGWRVWGPGDTFGPSDGRRARPGRAVGHTGYTGGFLRIDRTRGTILVILTNRVHPEDAGNVTPLRRSLVRAFDAVVAADAGAEVGVSRNGR